MDFCIAGKTAIVTAASRGLGAACAEALAAEGCRVVLFSRSAAPLEATASRLRAAHHAEIIAVSGDMREAADVARLVSTAQSAFGGPDILVLNTGRPPTPMGEVLEEKDPARWEEAYRTQLWAAIQVLSSVAPLMVERRWGRIVAVTSTSVKQPMPKHSLSTVFRAGLTGYLKHLANETAASGVTVNAVCPSSVGTEALRSSYNMDERIGRVPMRRLGKPEELAAAVAFFASEGAGFITGASLQVDGGLTGSLI
jgi:3-oxoacyl-[acyl-carrier protein] reductase